MVATTVWPSMALPSRRTPMRAFDRPTVGCCPSVLAPGRIRGSPPAPGRIRGGQSSNWRPLWSCGNGLDHFFELCPPRILPEAGAEGQHQPGERTEARMGVRLLGRAMLSQTVVAAIIYDFVGTD